MLGIDRGRRARPRARRAGGARPGARERSARRRASDRPTTCSVSRRTSRAPAGRAGCSADSPAGARLGAGPGAAGRGELRHPAAAAAPPPCPRRARAGAGPPRSTGRRRPRVASRARRRRGRRARPTAPAGVPRPPVSRAGRRAAARRRWAVIVAVVLILRHQRRGRRLRARAADGLDEPSTQTARPQRQRPDRAGRTSPRPPAARAVGLAQVLSRTATPRLHSSPAQGLAARRLRAVALQLAGSAPSCWASSPPVGTRRRLRRPRAAADERRGSSNELAA